MLRQNILKFPDLKCLNRSDHNIFKIKFQDIPEHFSKCQHICRTLSKHEAFFRIFQDKIYWKLHIFFKSRYPEEFLGKIIPFLSLLRLLKYGYWKMGSR